MSAIEADFWFPDEWELNKIKPVKGNVLIAPREKPRASKILHSPDQSRHDSFIGTVLTVADDAQLVERGDLVIWAPYSHRSVELHGNLLYIVHWSDIVAKVLETVQAV